MSSRSPRPKLQLRIPRRRWQGASAPELHHRSNRSSSEAFMLIRSTSLPWRGPTPARRRARRSHERSMGPAGAKNTNPAGYLADGPPRAQTVLALPEPRLVAPRRSSVFLELGCGCAELRAGRPRRARPRMTRYRSYRLVPASPHDGGDVHATFDEDCLSPKDKYAAVDAMLVVITMCLRTVSGVGDCASLTPRDRRKRYKYDDASLRSSPPRRAG